MCFYPDLRSILKLLFIMRILTMFGICGIGVHASFSKLMDLGGKELEKLKVECEIDEVYAVLNDYCTCTLPALKLTLTNNKMSCTSNPAQICADYSMEYKGGSSCTACLASQIFNSTSSELFKFYFTY
ncbi:MAG: hypothetical protein MHMPM18_004546 [Marteilia pararefringens]